MSETQDNLNLQIQEVLSELKQQRHEVSSLRDEVRGNSINVAAEVKRIKTEKDISWKFRGNRVQFEFNNELGDAVKQATWAMENGKEAYCKELINEIYKPHTEYLGFAWKNETGVMIYYKFVVLPFGLSSACHVFTKLTRPLIDKWRGEGKLVSMFLDDGFGCCEGYENAFVIGSEIKTDLLASGFIPNAEKSIWIPVQVLTYLGVLLNSSEGIISIPESRLLKVKNYIDSILNAVKVHRRVGVRKLASLVGQILSMKIVVGHVAQIMTRSLSIDVVSSNHWDSNITISDESLNQIGFWRTNLKCINEKDIFESHKCTKVVFSDASNTGFAGYEIKAADDISHGIWSIEETLQSSTWRELTAVYRVLESLMHLLKYQKVKWFTDNKGVESIVKKGSMKDNLQCIAISIYKLCLKHAISLEIEWIPRLENERADYLSKIIDIDDWGLSDQTLEIIQCRYGSVEVDWFASEHNAKVKLFYSRYWCPSTSGIDAFAEFWGKRIGLFVPPIPVISRVIRKMVVDKAIGVLVIPAWRSAPFWPLICQNGQFIKNIIDWADLPTEKQYYSRCRNGKGMFGNIDLKFRMLALYVDFR